MSAGIYMFNGVLAYSMNLEKKLKRRKGAIVIEEYEGENPTEADLIKLLNKHNNITKTEDISDLPLKYNWINLKTKCSSHSVHPYLTIKEDVENWIPFTYKDSNTIIIKELPDTKSILGRDITNIEYSDTHLTVFLK